MGEVQYGCSWGGGAPTLVVVVPELVGTLIVCPIKSSASGDKPLSAASVAGERPFAPAIDDRLSPGVTMWEAPEVAEGEEEPDETPAEASAAAPSATVGIWIVFPA